MKGRRGGWVDNVGEGEAIGCAGGGEEREEVIATELGAANYL